MPEHLTRKAPSKPVWGQLKGDLGERISRWRLVDLMVTETRDRAFVENLDIGNQMVANIELVGETPPPPDVSEI